MKIDSLECELKLNTKKAINKIKELREQINYIYEDKKTTKDLIYDILLSVYIFGLFILSSHYFGTIIGIHYILISIFFILIFNKRIRNFL